MSRDRYTLVQMLRGFWGRRKLILLCVAAGSVLGIVLIFLLPAVGVSPFIDQYRYVGQARIWPVYPPQPLRSQLGYDINYHTVELLGDPVTLARAEQTVAQAGSEPPTYVVEAEFDPRGGEIRFIVESTQEPFLEEFVPAVLHRARQDVVRRLNQTLSSRLVGPTSSEIAATLSGLAEESVTDDEELSRIDTLIDSRIAERTIESFSLPWSDPLPYVVGPKQLPLLVRNPFVGLSFFTALGVFFGLLLVLVLDYLKHERARNLGAES